MLKISVITAVYNRKKTISQALDSVLSQTYPMIESIVIDGGSTDGTLDVLESFRSQLTVLISERDEGMYDALNKGISHATGDVIGFLHSDDFFEHNSVLAKIALAFEDPSVQAVYGDLLFASHENTNKIIRYCQPGNYNDSSFSKGWSLPHPTFYVRRSIYEQLGGFNVSYHIAADYDTVVRFLAVAKITSKYIPEVLIRMRSGGLSNQSLTAFIRKLKEDFSVIKRNKIGGIGTLLLKNFSKIKQLWKRQ